MTLPSEETPMSVSEWLEAQGSARSSEYFLHLTVLSLSSYLYLRHRPVSNNPLDSFSTSLHKVPRASTYYQCTAMTEVSTPPRTRVLGTSGMIFGHSYSS